MIRKILSIYFRKKMKLHRTTSLYLARHFVLTFVAILIVLMAVVVLVDSIELIRRTAKLNVGFLQILEISAFKMPALISPILPFVVMIAAMIVFARLSKNQELIVMRALGISAWQFLSPIVISAFLIGVVNITAFNPMAAGMQTRAERMQEKLSIGKANPLSFSKSGLWLREVGEDNIAFISHARSLKQQVSQDVILSGFTRIALKDDYILEKTWVAPEVTLKDGAFIIHNGFEVVPEEEPLKIKEIPLKTSLSFLKIQEAFSSPETMSFWELPSFIRFFDEAGFSSHKHRIYFYSLLVSPFFLAAIIFVSAAFSLTKNARQGAMFYRIVSGILMGFILYFTSQMTYALGRSDNLPTFLAIAAPTLIFLTISITMLLHQEDG